MERHSAGRTAAKLALIVLTALTACSDENMHDIRQTPADITADAGEIRLPLRASYCSVTVSAATADVSGLPVTTDAGWIELMADTVARDGIVEIFADRKDDSHGRSGTITVGGPDSGLSIPVYQCGTVDDGNNGGIRCFAGCGYNIFRELNSESSLCDTVIDYDAARALDPMLIQTVGRNLQDVKTITSNSTIEMADLMTSTVEKTRTSLIGNKKTVTRFEQNDGSVKLDVTGYAYINLQRIVACSSLDFSKVIQYAADGRNLDIFTPRFRSYYDRIVANPTNENIFGLFKVFGTHLVSYVDLGGSMDIALSFNKTMSGELNMRADDFQRYFFRWDSSDYTLNGEIQGLSTDVSNEGTFKIAGGSDETRQAIINDCRTGHRIRPENIRSWEKSLPVRDFMSPEAMDALVPLNVQLVPIWSLFPQNLANIFFQCAIAESQKSNNAVDDYSAGLDNYAIQLSPEMLRFDDSPEESLVRVLYATNSPDIARANPILEVCHEYVPVLDAGRRIPVIYPIRNGRPFHGTGLFPGNGFVGPAWLTFSDGEVYVRPVDRTQLKSSTVNYVYYLHGNIYLSPLGLDLSSSAVTREWRAKGILGMPIVKIGSGYWSRRNLTTRINTGYYYGADDFRLRDLRMDNGEYWVEISGVCRNPPEGVGDEVDRLYDKPIKWYYPTHEDRNSLMKYIGHDPRHLLKGQLTGFDAQFEGFYGPGGIDGVPKSSKRQLHGAGNCYLIFKETVDASSGSAMRLGPDYRWTEVKTGTGYENFFPLRLFRSSYYLYDKFGNAKDNYTRP